MKRLIIAISLLLCSVLLSVFGYFDLRTNSKKLIKSLEDTVTSVNSGKNEEIKENIEKALDIWESCETRFKIYMDHAELDDIIFSANELEQYLNGDREIEVSDICFDCINRLNHIVESETPSIGEIL